MKADAARRMLVLICLVSGGWACSFGLGSQVVTHWLKFHGASNSLIGLNHATHYLGLAIGSLLAPRLIGSWGMRGCSALGLILSGVSLSVFPWTGGASGWFAIRFVNGLASALSLIPLETFISRDAPAGQRTRFFAFYGLALTLGGALGIWSGLNLYRPGRVLAFILGGAVPVVGSLALLQGFSRAASAFETSSAPFATNTSRSVLSFGTAWCQGFLEGGMLAFLSLYLLAQGLSTGGAGGLMSLTLIGVIVFQVPVSWLADRMGNVPVLLGCYGVVLAGLAAVPCCEPTFWLGTWLFLVGAASGAMYPLGLALLGEQQAESHLARAYAWYLAMECVGSQMGAAAMGQARDWWGEAGMFPVGIAALFLALLPWVVLILLPRRQAPHILVFPAPGHVDQSWKKAA